jgi:hypothetical protein
VGASAEQPAVKAKVVLIDPSSMTVVWMNEAALQDLADPGADSLPGTPVARAVPLGDTLGLEEAVRSAADSGRPRHLSTNLVSTVRGSVAIAASVYPVPSGEVLLVMENAYRPTHTKPEPGTGRASRRRR